MRFGVCVCVVLSSKYITSYFCVTVNMHLTDSLSKDLFGLLLSAGIERASLLRRPGKVHAVEGGSEGLFTLRPGSGNSNLE